MSKGKIRKGILLAFKTLGILLAVLSGTCGAFFVVILNEGNEHFDVSGSLAYIYISLIGVIPGLIIYWIARRAEKKGQGPNL